MNIIGLVIAGVLGALVCYINFLLSRWILTKKSNYFSLFTIVRQIINIDFLVLCYLLAPFTPFDKIYLLIGGALGITLPMFFFTGKLLKISKKTNKNDGSESNKKEE